MAVIRQDIIKYLTDRPGQVIYRDEIVEAGGFTPGQVAAAVRSTQQDSPIGSEIEVVVRGRAWRYVPRQPTTMTTSPNGEVAPDLTLPLTSLIRQYLIDHPGQTVWATQLATYSGRDLYQVKIGVANMRRIQSNQDVTRYVTTTMPGQSWRFDPPPSWRVGIGAVRPPTSSPAPPPLRPVASPVPAVRTSTVEPTDEPTNGDDRPAEDVVDAELFELVGRTDDAMIIRDDAGNLYRATPLT